LGVLVGVLELLQVVLILRWKRGMTGWRWRLLTAMIVTVTTIVAHTMSEEQNQTVVESKISRPISKKGEKYMMVGLLLYLVASIIFE